jgi:hypothetical protein
VSHPDNPNGLKYAIRKLDENNWQIHEWQAGGDEITRGRFVGQITQAKWKPMDSYHGDVDGAVRWLMKAATLANAPKHQNLDTEAILAALEAARADVIAAAEAVTPEEFKKKSARGRKGKE